MELSLIIPIYNEEPILYENLEKIYQYLNSIKKVVNRYEIIIINNGSTDNSVVEISKILTRHEHLTFIDLSQKGLGLALKFGLSCSKLNNIMFFPIDMPFGYNIILDSVAQIKAGYDLVLGSKAHHESIIRINKKRKYFSYFYNFLVRKLFKIQIFDTQGTFLIKKTIINKILPYLNSTGPVFQTELVIYSHYAKASIVEFPVVYIENQRPSHMKISDAFKIINNLLICFIKFPEIRKKLI